MCANHERLSDTCSHEGMVGKGLLKTFKEKEQNKQRGTKEGQ